MTYLCNARNKTLTTANAELYLTVIGFSHMWSYTMQGGLSSGRSVISVARVSLSLCGISRFSSLRPTPLLLYFLSHSRFLYLAPVLLYGRYVIIEMSSCRCFDNPITRAFAQPVCNAALCSPEILQNSRCPPQFYAILFSKTFLISSCGMLVNMVVGEAPVNMRCVFLNLPIDSCLFQRLFYTTLTH